MLESDTVLEARDFMSSRSGAESDLRSLFSGDLQFCFELGAQWEDEARQKRAGRPCYTYNRTVGAVNQLVGDQRRMKASGKVRRLTRGSTVATAELLSGICRDIEAQSFAQNVYDEAFKYAAAGAWGVWRIMPAYLDDESFDQVLRIVRVANPLNVYLDGVADPWGRGGMQALVVERISKQAFHAQYGNFEHVSNFPSTYDGSGWWDDKEVRIGEYYKMIAEQRQIVLLSDGRIVEDTESLRRELAQMQSELGDAALRVETRETGEEYAREVTDWKCQWTKTDGFQILEGPYEYDYRHIPIVRLPGRFINIEGEDKYESLHRHGHDAARTYNYNRSAMVETVALQPRAPYVGTAPMFEGYEDDWARANVSNAPYLRYNVDPEVPELRPERARMPEIPQAYIALAAHDAEDIRQTIGYTNPAVEQQTRAGDAESGRALRTRLSAGDSGSYEFIDNYRKAIAYSWEICVDMIPSTYDTERVQRLLMQDGREEFVDVAPEDLKRGRYDTTVTIGPAYATARAEALDTLMTAAEVFPVVAEEAPDIIVRNLDVQGADEIEKRIRWRLIREGRIKPTEADTQEMPPPPKPSPEQTALAGRLEAQAQRDRASAAKTTVETASEMATSQTAMRREMLELRELVADIAQKQAETMKTISEALAARTEARTDAAELTRPPAGGA